MWGAGHGVDAGRVRAAAPEPYAIDESADVLPPTLRRSPLVRVAARALQLVCLFYGVVLLYWIYLAKGLAIGVFLSDPVFYTYSLLVTLYCLARFLLAPFYRPVADTGYRPTASIVVPAFNEEECIALWLRRSRRCTRATTRANSSRSWSWTTARRTPRGSAS